MVLSEERDILKEENRSLKLKIQGVSDNLEISLRKKEILDALVVKFQRENEEILIENRRLSSSIEDFNETLGVLKGEREKLMNINEGLEVHIRKIAKDLTDSQAAANTVKVAIVENLEFELENQKRKYIGLKNKNEDLQTQNENLKGEIEAQKKENKEWEEQNYILIADNENFLRSIDNLKSDHEYFKQISIEKFSISMEEKNHKLEHLKTLYSKLQQTDRIKSEELDEMFRVCGKLIKMKNQFKSEIEILNKKFNEADISLQSHNEEVRKFKRRLKTANEKNISLETVNENLIDKIKELNESKTQSKQNLETFEKAHANLNDEKRKLQIEREKQNQMVELLRQDLNIKIEIIEGQRKNINDLNKNQNEMTAKIQDYHKALKTHEKEIQKMNAENKDLETNLTRELESLKIKNKKQIEEISILHHELDENVEVIEGHKDKFDDLKAFQNKLKEENKKLLKAIDEVRSSHETLKIKSAEKFEALVEIHEKKIENLKLENTNLQ
jgi:chromosome segregation ATPase